MKVLRVLVVLAAASLAACGGQGPAQRSAAAPDIQSRAAAPVTETDATPVATVAQKHKRKPTAAPSAGTPAAAGANAMEVTVRHGTKLSEIRKGVGALLSHGGAPQRGSKKRASRPLVAIAPPPSQKTPPARKSGSSLLDRLAQGKLPSN